MTISLTDFKQADDLTMLCADSGRAVTRIAIRLFVA